MGGAAEKWRPGRGRRPGWGTLAGGVDGGAGGGRGPGGSGGPGGGGRAAAAAPSAPPGASGLGLWLRGAAASRSSLRLCRSSSRRCRRRRRCSCCHSPRPGPRRRQLRTRPGQPLHPRGGVARPRRAGRAGGQRGHSSQARGGRSRPPRRQPPAAPAAASTLTLMLRGARAPGGTSLPGPSPSHGGSRPGRAVPRRAGFVWWPRHRCCPRHVTNPGRGRPASCPQLRQRASPGAIGRRPLRPCPALPCRDTRAWRAPRGLGGKQAGAGALASRDASPRRLLIYCLHSGVPLSSLTPPHANWLACPLRNPVALDF